MSAPVPCVFDLLHDLHLCHVKFVLRVQQALAANGEHLRQNEGIALFAALDKRRKSKRRHLRAAAPHVGMLVSLAHLLKFFPSVLLENG